jgi:hypothetical protein
MWNVIVLFHFENRQGFLPHSVEIKRRKWKIIFIKIVSRPYGLQNNND